MVNIKSPLIDAVMDDQTRQYVSILERQVIGLTIALSQCRAVLQSVTGVPHEDYVKDLGDKTVMQVAEMEIAKRLSCTPVEAKRLAARMFSGEDIGLRTVAQTTMNIDPQTGQPVVLREETA